MRAVLIMHRQSFLFALLMDNAQRKRKERPSAPFYCTKFGALPDSFVAAGELIADGSGGSEVRK